MSREKLLLIDGHSIANRAFYGLPPLTNAEGLHTNAILGFINILTNVYTKVKPDYILVAFDLKEKTFRHKMFEDYKGTRKGMPEELHEQIPVLKDVLNSMKISTASLPGYEADDILGTYAKKAESEGVDVVILSGDRDLLQLATDTTMIAIPKTKSGGTETETYFAKDVLEKYQVTPTEFIDVKALMGDTSDNIPGIPGIGEKTATNIIVKYKSLENAIEHADEIKPPRASRNLIEFKEQGIMSKTLATIVTDAPCELDFHEAKVEEKDFFNSNSYELFKRLEFNRLLKKFDAGIIAESSGNSLEYYIKPFDEFEKVIENSGEMIGLYFSKDLSLCAISGDKGIFVFENDGSEFPFIVQEKLISLFKSGKAICVFGLKDMLHALDIRDFRSNDIFDIEIMAYLLNPLNSAYSFDMISKEYLGRIIPSKADLIGKEEMNSDIFGSDKRRNAGLLAASVSQTALNAFEPLKKSLEDTEMWELFISMEMPLIYSLYYMEKEGILVNREILNDLSRQLDSSISSYEQEIYKEAGEEFNINSPKQLGNILFEKLKLPHGRKTKTGYSTSADILEKLAEDHPFVKNILLYRQASKLKSTYSDGLVNFISEDGRIHGTFNQTITATGRISSTDPNLQNIPTRTELGQEIRKAFVAKEGCVFLDADYSQIELRLLAHMSDDKNLIEAYKSDADIHKITASKVFNTPLDDVTKTQRRNAKAVNFGIVYGISSFGLSQDLSISRKEAEGYIKQYFETYPDVKKFLNDTVRNAKINGFTTTMYGRRRPIPELASSNFMQRSFGERAAMNAPIQGSAADIMKIAMINVERALREAGLESRIVLQVHDELLIEAPMAEVSRAKDIIEREMRNAAFLNVPLEVDCNAGKDWYEAH